MITSVILLDPNLTLRAALRVREDPLRILALPGALHQPLLHHVTGRRGMGFLATFPAHQIPTGAFHSLQMRCTPEHEITASRWTPAEGRVVLDEGTQDELLISLPGFR